MKKLIAALLLLCLVACGTPTEVPTETPTEVPTEAPMETPTVTPVETRAPSSVYTDWSKLTPYQPAQQLYSYHPGYTGEGSFVARDDYGVLLPYIGKYDTAGNWTSALPIYGLVTERGELVSDPVYAHVFCCEGFLFLYRAHPAGTRYDFTLAAPDGSWVHELGASDWIDWGHGLAMTGASDGSLDLWNLAGQLVAHFDASRFEPWLGKGFHSWERMNDFVEWIDDRVGYIGTSAVNGGYVRLYLDFTSGTVTDTPPEGYPAKLDFDTLGDIRQVSPPVVSGGRDLSSVTDTVTGEIYFRGGYRGGKGEPACTSLFDSEGQLLSKSSEPWTGAKPFFLRAGLYSTIEKGCFCYWSLADSTLVFRYAIKTNSD